MPPFRQLLCPANALKHQSSPRLCLSFIAFSDVLRSRHRYHSTLTVALPPWVPKRTTLPSREWIREHSKLLKEDEPLVEDEAPPLELPVVSQEPFIGPIIPVPGPSKLVLKLYQPPSFSEKTPTILHLPYYPSPSFERLPPITPSVSASLLASASCAVFEASYPDGSPPRFPAILCDAVAAFDRIRSLFPRAPTGIYGSGLSGGIALSIALTEKHVSCVAVKNPIVDLFALGDVLWDEVSSSWIEPYPEGKLPTLRRNVYGSDPTWWTDPFASPLYFLRTVGMELSDQAAGVGLKKRRRFRTFGGAMAARMMIGLEPGSVLTSQGTEFLRSARHAILSRNHGDADMLANIAEEHVGTIDVTGVDAADVLGGWLGDALQEDAKTVAPKRSYVKEEDFSDWFTAPTPDMMMESGHVEDSHGQDQENGASASEDRIDPLSVSSGDMHRLLLAKFESSPSNRNQKSS